MSLETLVSDDLAKHGRLSAGTLAYLAGRARANCYDYVMRRFGRSGLSQAELARRIGKDPAQVNRMLSTSGNWTIGTIAELLAAISEEEFIPSSQTLRGRIPRNFTQADLLARLLDGFDDAAERDLEGMPTGSSAPVLDVKPAPVDA